MDFCCIQQSILYKCILQFILQICFHISIVFIRLKIKKKKINRLKQKIKYQQNLVVRSKVCRRSCVYIFWKGWNKLGGKRSKPNRRNQNVINDRYCLLEWIRDIKKDWIRVTHRRNIFQHCDYERKPALKQAMRHVCILCQMSGQKYEITECLTSHPHSFTSWCKGAK